MTATGLSALTLADLSTQYKDPRIHDLRIAKRLGMERSRDIRQLVERNREELEGYGPLAVRHRKSRGQEFTEYWLNEPQALLICMLSRTECAAVVRHEVISVYMQWRRQAHAAPGWLPLPGSAGGGDGRYLVVVQGGGVTEVRPLAGHSLVDGGDAENVSTFLREFVPDTGLPGALDTILRRICHKAGISPAVVPVRQNRGVA